MYESAHTMLLDADETFTSVVELNYRGDLGGDEVNFYKDMNFNLSSFNFNKLESDPNVRAVDMENSAWTWIDDNKIKRSNTPLSDYVMVKVGSIFKDNLYMGTVDGILFGQKVRDNSYIMINDLDEQGTSRNYNFIADHEYLIIGQIAVGRTATYTLSPGLPVTAGVIPCVIDLTANPNFFLSEEGEKILKLQEAMKVVDNSLQVTAVSSLEASAPYYFNDLLMKEGRIFKPSEYEEGNNEVILISEKLADFYQVRVGEAIKLKLHYNRSGVGISDYLTDNKFDYEATYKVVGIFKSKDDNKYTIYMPKAGWLKQELHSTNLARYIVNNGTGTEFIDDNRKGLLPNMDLTLYDQGYGEAVKPIIALKNSAVIVILLGSLSGIAILILFSYLYVIKQKDTLKTMLSLGTGIRNTMNYILFGAGILVFCASSIGALFSGFFLKQVTQRLFKSMINNYGTDLRYSERAIGSQMNFIPQARVNLWLPVIIVFVIVLISIIILFSFTSTVLRQEKQVSLKNSIKKEITRLPRKVNGKKLVFGRIRPITLKFALISLTRSPGRSIIIPFISLILSVFIIYLGLLSGIQQEKLDTVYDRIPVKAYMTSPMNETRDVGGLKLEKDIYRLIEPEDANLQSGTTTVVNKNFTNTISNEDFVSTSLYSSLAEEARDKILADSEFFDKMYLYSAIHYEYMGISMTKEGEEAEALSYTPDIRIHNNSNGFDWFLNKMKKMPKLAYADDLRYTPDFFNNSEPEVEFLKGYSFASLQLKENIAIISRNFAATYGIENGDVIRITEWASINNYAVCNVNNLKVVGIYDAKWRTDTIYLPWIMNYDHYFLYDFDYPVGVESNSIIVSYGLAELIPSNVRAATFTLKNTDSLSAFRDYLEKEDYSQIGKMGDNRRVIVIQDKQLVETVQSLKNHIRLIETIKPVMLILFGIVGFAVSYLLIRHRMNEFAIMRSMGAKKRQVFFSFFLEQLMLFFIGLIPTAIYAIVLPGKIILYIIPLLCFVFCYLLGTALALIMMNRAKILDILFTKE